MDLEAWGLVAVTRRRSWGSWGGLRRQWLWALLVVCSVAAACSGAPIGDEDGAGSEGPGGQQADGIADGAGSEGLSDQQPGGEWGGAGSCDMACEPGSADAVYHQVVAFGSLDGDGRADPVPLAGVTIVAIPTGFEGWIDDYDFVDAVTGEAINKWTVCEVYKEFAWSQFCYPYGPYSIWLHRVGGVGAWQQALRLEHNYNHRDDLVGEPPVLPPYGIFMGEQVQSSPDSIVSVPGVVVATTDADGTAKLRADPRRRYALCATSPQQPGLIAGCSHTNYIGLSDRESYGVGLGGGPSPYIVYFSYGRAYIAPAGNHLLTRAWYETLAQRVFGRDWSAAVPVGPALRPDSEPEPGGEATLEVVAELSRLNDPGTTTLALVRDSDIGRWWDAFSGPDQYAYLVAANNHPEFLITTPDRVAASPAQIFELEVPANVAASENPGFIGTITVASGVYLTCWIDVTSTDIVIVDVCRYDEFPASFNAALVLEGTATTMQLGLAEAGYRPPKFVPGEPVPVE